MNVFSAQVIVLLIFKKHASKNRNKINVQAQGIKTHILKYSAVILNDVSKDYLITQEKICWHSKLKDNVENNIFGKTSHTPKKKSIISELRDYS